MLQGWVIIAVALTYIGLLFAVASLGDQWRPRAAKGRGRPYIYALSLAVYCTSWTFFGSVGLATTQGLNFLTIYIGPVIIFTLATPFLLRIIRLAKAQNITSIADFIAARYGKSQGVAALVAGVAILGALPYIALQLKAVSASLLALLGDFEGLGLSYPVVGDLALFVAVAMAAFAVLFGTRHIDATEHQEGLMLAIATESIVKLVAFLAVGLFVTFVMFAGPADLFAQARRARRAPGADQRLLPGQLDDDDGAVLARHPDAAAPVPCRRGGEYLRAGIAHRALAVPALSGADQSVRGADRHGRHDLLPARLHRRRHVCARSAALGGRQDVRAARLRRRAFRRDRHGDRRDRGARRHGLQRSDHAADGAQPPHPRRRAGQRPAGSWARVRTAAATWAPCCSRCAGSPSSSSCCWPISITALPARRSLRRSACLSFAAVAQFGPAFLIGLMWRRATALGAIAGIAAGVVLWAYTLLLPSLADSAQFGSAFLAQGPFGFELLRPQALFGLHAAPLTHGVVWSLGVNLICLVVVSLLTQPAPIERLQASVFVEADRAPSAPSFRLWRSPVTVEELIGTVARYLGEERTRASFESVSAMRGVSLEPGREADFQLIRYAEHLLASAIGAASSRLVLSLLLRKRTVSTKAALKLLDDASAAIQYNREILQTALDHVRQGIAVFDRDLRLVCWNRQFGDMLDLPPEIVRIGIGIDDILRFNARAGLFGPGMVEEIVRERLGRYSQRNATFLERLAPRGVVMEVRVNAMPDHGAVVTFTDITPTVEAAEALERANETLEKRVRERTKALEHLNAQLALAKSEAEEANISKTRFLAAASHDILQPLNAARLYATSLVERAAEGEPGRLAENVDASLEAVEEILAALLDISRLDAGAMKPEVAPFRIDDIFRQLELEFAPLARERGLDLTFVTCSASVRSDRRLLRRLLQNLVSNAIKYTPKGRVLVGARHRRGKLRIEVLDTGPGIPQGKQKLVFKEFQRLDQGAKAARGLGLGLSIVERHRPRARPSGRSLPRPRRMAAASLWRCRLPLPCRCRSGRSAPSFAPSAALDGLTVLCIDNDPTILDGMETLLTGWGCRVVKAPGAASALGTLREARLAPDVLLIDYHLDEGDGIEAARNLRWKLGRTLPAVLITADRSKTVRDAARTTGMEVLNKPVRPAALRALLAQWRVARTAAE